ncbi:MAG TPA: PAS domain S-box protein [candidate division Zixibacteria bacterium]|nr:PAS domain S-box protein [candidate division Zixibacteria bacterium]
MVASIPVTGPQSSFAVQGVSFQQLSHDEIISRLAAIVGSATDAIIGRDERGIINTWNPAATCIFGFSPEEMIGHSFLLLVPPELHAQEREIDERLRRGETVESYETQRIRKGGTRIDVSIAISAVRDPDGHFCGAALIIRDMGTMAREDAARARLAAIIDSSEDAIIAKDLNGVVTDWNTAAENMFGYTAQEIVGRSILTIIPPELQHEEPVILAKILAGSRIEHYETVRVNKSGKRIEVSLSLSPIRDVRGRIIGTSKIAREISERRRADTEHAMLAAIVESSEDAIISKNLDGIIMSWNSSAERLFGYKPEEIIGHSVMRLIPPELHYEEPEIIAKLRRGERIQHFETRRMHKDGHILDISLTVSPVKDSQGRIIGASKIVRDISDRKAAERALIEREKLAAAGRLAATLAHEVNNPLESITNLAYLLCENPSLDANAREYARLLMHEVQRAGEITRQTLGFYRESRVSGPVDLIDILDHVLRSRKSKFEKKRIDVVRQFSTLPRLNGLPGELRQVFENLLANATDAVGMGGHIRVRARTLTGSDHHRVAISVCDDGVGIAHERLRVIFDPFFTTKMWSGTGLGLWVTREILRKHGGTIRVRSTEGKGSVFTVTLPVPMKARREVVTKKAG